MSDHRITPERSLIEQGKDSQLSITSSNYGELYRPLPGKKPNLQQQILESLIDGEELTSLNGLQKFKTLEVRKFVSNLRAEGWKIGDRWQRNPGTGKRFKVYFLKQGA